MHPRRGFTIVELLLVIAIISIVGTIAITNVLLGKRVSNERVGLVTLKQIHKAQALFQERCARDKDGDSVGEFATDFQELTGDNSSGFLAPDVVSISWINLIPTIGQPDRTEKSGYLFQIYTSADAGAESVNDDETQFLIVAWPKKAGKTGMMCYAITETGQAYSFTNDLSQFDGANSPVTLNDVYGTPFNPATLGMGAVQFRPKD